MKLRYALPVAAVLSLAALGACSKPATETAADATDAAGNTASMAADGAIAATDAGGVVSPPEANGAINTDGNAMSSDVAAASNSFTEGQAKGHIENAGYTEVMNLAKTPDGMWTAKAKKDGKTMDVAVDFKGAVTAK